MKNPGEITEGCFALQVTPKGNAYKLSGKRTGFGRNLRRDDLYRAEEAISFYTCFALSIIRENLSGQWYGDALGLSASPFLIFRKGEIIYGKENSAL